MGYLNDWESLLKVASNSFGRTIAGVLAGAALIFSAGMMLGKRFQRPVPVDSAVINRLNQLDSEIKQLHTNDRGIEQLQTKDLPASDIVASSRNSICFIVSTYGLSDPLAPEDANSHRVLASGFLVSGNTVVSNRHVLEPWFGDPVSQGAMRRGAIPHRGRILAYFPGLREPLELSHIVVSQSADLAIAHVDLLAGASIPALHLASQAGAAGDAVVVIGYPLGVTTMLAKTSATPYEVSSLRQDQREVEHLAEFRLIRPTATQGHLADTIDTTLMYDASTAHGSSGGPVFNMRGEVIGVNAALLNGFSGTSLGISTTALLPLLEAGRKH